MVSKNPTQLTGSHNIFSIRSDPYTMFEEVFVKKNLNSRVFKQILIEAWMVGSDCVAIYIQLFARSQENAQQKPWPLEYF